MDLATGLCNNQLHISFHCAPWYVVPEPILRSTAVKSRWISACELEQHVSHFKSIYSLIHLLSMPLWIWDIWYDSPSLPKASNLTDRGSVLQKVFPGLVAGQSARILVDSGATHCFISHAYAQSQSLLLCAEKSDVACGGGSVSSPGYVDLPVDMHTFSAKLKLKLTAIPLSASSSFDVILGQSGQVFIAPT